LLKRTLEVGALESIASALFNEIPLLHVRTRCACGCPTVWFARDGETTASHLLAGALANVDETVVEVRVWSNGSHIVGLEFVGPHAGFSLPDASSLRRVG